MRGMAESNQQLSCSYANTLVWLSLSHKKGLLNIDPVYMQMCEVLHIEDSLFLPLLLSKTNPLLKALSFPAP